MKGAMQEVDHAYYLERMVVSSEPLPCQAKWPIGHLVNYTLHLSTFRPNRIPKASYLFPFSRTFPSVKYVIKMTW